jgi:hypothetical protein
MEVPDMMSVAELREIPADLISEPGAKMSTHPPKLENEDRLSSLAVDPTVMALGSEAGDVVQASG